MVDTEKLRQMLNQYVFTSKPSSGNYSAPCTVGDLNRVVTNTARLLAALIAEIEQSK